MAGCGTKRMKAGGPTGTKKMMMGGMAKNSGYKKGGKIDGCAKRGRTNCKMV